MQERRNQQAMGFRLKPVAIRKESPYGAGMCRKTGKIVIRRRYPVALVGCRIEKTRLLKIFRKMMNVPRNQRSVAIYRKAGIKIAVRTAVPAPVHS